MEALQEDGENRRTVIKKKLPTNILIQLEESNESKHRTVKGIRERFGSFIAAREAAEASAWVRSRYEDFSESTASKFQPKSTTGALLDSEKPRKPKR